MAVSTRALHSYFAHGWLRRLFFACRDEDVDAAYEEWAQAQLLTLAKRELNVEDGDLTRHSDMV
jgi:hypothetical protein